ncbi:MAG: response regulator [Elusimicrobia bacterium]|nr:response regulator [Elusimicrobiota bacterium]MDE2313815.1 response regulator [Elusimicrobiota bacterium]
MANILIVDDENDVVSLIKFLLEKDGHAVSQASDGVMALEKIGFDQNGARKGEFVRFDLIILDVMMPLMDGYTVSAKLSSDPLARSIPIIVLTAKGGLQDIFTPASNVVAYISKPFDPKKLRQTVADILAARGTQEGRP